MANGALLRVDGVEDSCELPDYPGSVDNALIDVADALTTITADGVHLDAHLQAGLVCDAEDPGCAALHVASDPDDPTCDAFSFGFVGSSTAVAGL